MKGTATIIDAKMTGAKAADWQDRNPKARLRLTVDMEMPAPSEPMSIDTWWKDEVGNYNERGAKQRLWQITQGQTNGGAPSLADLAASDDEDDDWDDEEEQPAPAKGKKGKAAKAEPKVKEMPWNWNPTAALLEEHYGADYKAYIETHRKDNQRALRASQEAGLLLLLIGKKVNMTVQPAQKAFAQLLKFDDSVQLLDEPAEAFN